MIRTGLASLLVALSLACSATERSSAEVRAFKRHNPCPTTGLRRGACPGYVIDHVIPLACGGADKPENMQWQTVGEAKEKDRWELKVYCPRANQSRVVR